MLKAFNFKTGELQDGSKIVNVAVFACDKVPTGPQCSSSLTDHE